MSTEKELIQIGANMATVELKEIVRNAITEGIRLGEMLKDAPELMTQATAARYIDVSPATINSWIRQKKIKTVYINGKRRITREELLNLIIKNR